MNSKKKILIVEDEMVIALDLRESLEESGYLVTEILSRGEDACHSIETVRPDLILMDIKLDGEIDGVETAQMVYEQFGIPVIFITSYSNRTIIEKTKKAHPFGYIIKPFEDKELLTNIEIAFYKHETELKLRENERKYRELSESIQQITVECDAYGKITYINEHGMQLLGLSAETLETSVMLSNFLINADFELMKQRILELPENRSRNRSYQFQSAHGKRIFIEEYLCPVYHNQNITGFRGLMIDVSSKWLKEQLLDLFEQFNNKFSNSEAEAEEIISEFIQQMKVLFPHVENIRYIPKPEQDKIFEQFIQPPAGRSFFCLTRQQLELLQMQDGLFQTGVSSLCGFPIYLSDEYLGAIIFTSGRKSNIFKEEDYETLSHFFQNIETLLNRLYYFRNIRKSKLAYEKLVNSVSEGILHLDFQFNIVFANSRILQMIAKDKEQVLGKSILKIVDFDENSKTTIKRAIQNGHASINSTYQLKFKRFTGDVVDIIINVTALKNELNVSEGILCTVLDVSDKLQLKRLTEESEQKFKAMFEQAAVGVAIMDINTGKFIEVNSKYCEIVGYSKSELSAVAAKQLTHRDDLPICTLQLERMRCNEIKGFTLEKRKIRKSGQVVWVNATVSALRKKDRTVSQYVIILEDITARKNIEKKLRTSEAEKENMLEAIPDSFAVINANQEILNAYFKNSEALILPEAHIFSHKKLSEIFVNDAATIIQEGVEECLQEKKLVIKELGIETTDSFFYELRFVSFSKKDVLLVIRNITELKNNLTELQKFYNASEQANELIFITDSKGCIEYVNPTFRSVTGYALEELKGKQPKVFKSDKHSKNFYASLWKTILAGNTFKAEVTNRKKNGELFIEEKIITPIKDKSGRITNFISTGRDVTEIRKKERKILTYQRFEKVLERREQKSRTLSLIRGQENERKRLAMELHDSLGQMLAITKANLDSVRLPKVIKKEEKSKILLAKQLVSEIIQESRIISNNLSPGSLYEFGLHKVIEQMIRNININVSGIQAQYSSNIQGLRFKSEVEINVYRIIQEAIQNIMKHSRATRFTIDINYDKLKFSLVIWDNGKGVNKKRLSGGNFKSGLNNIEERGKAMDAEIAFDSDVGQGFLIKLSLKTKSI